MLAYHGKLLELKGIEIKSDKYYLHTMFSFEEDIELFCEIDEYTANQLTSIIQLDNKYKYRLSFNHSFDKLQEQNIATLTQTYLEYSDKISFSCSENFVDMLTTIKNIQDIHELDNLNFISRTLEEINEEPVAKEIHTISEILEKSKIKFTPMLIIASSIVLIILFSYFNQGYINKARTNEGVLAQSINSGITVDLHEEKSITEIDLSDKEDLSTEGPLIEEINKPTPHSVTLDNDEMIYKVPHGKVALTFDDGPSQYSIDIMNVLNEYEVGGTFFFTGISAKKYPDYIKSIQSKGYSIGSHSMNHVDMKTLSYENQKNEIIQSIELLEEIIDDEVVLFRPPYGSINKQVKDLVYGHEYKLVLWNNDPEDWKTRDADKIFNSIKNSDISGSIILLHESQAVIDALPRIIEYLQELDLKIVNLE
ncbi:polysaccharide deacetylase family protein [Tissierella sp.]|uniref:polysaccharide deacetylase family protein n=1 Tax=Tissierella sp. TaxID=41274 RepID=UPI00285BA431|nr:polysaccharide deacetylase family protein [Tissierella sp.]MDR7855054.1 polysaccharide deacetylase family protein [Tissierella sp.]